MTTILYIDDEPLVADASVQFLKHSGFEVEKALSGKEALEKLRAGRYDAVISDYQMPGMTGIELLRIIRSEIGDIPFILFTGKGREEVVIEAIEEGVDFYVQKGGSPGPLFADLTHKINHAIKQRESDRQLRKNEERLRKAQEIGKIGSWEHVIDSEKIWLSEEALRLYGMNGQAREVPVTDVFDLICERERVNNAYTNLIEHGIEYHIEYSIIPADKSAPRILLSIATIEEGEPGSRGRIVGIIQDITEKKNSEWRLTKKNADLFAALEKLTATEEQLTRQLHEVQSAHERLAESEERYRKLFEKNIVGTAVHEIICDESGTPVNYRFLDVNPAFEQMTGLSAHDVTGRTVLDVLPGTEPYWITIYGHVALTGTPIHFEEFSQELDKFFEVFAYASQPGQFVTLFQDITDRKRRESYLNESNVYLENLIAYANVPIIVWDPDFVISRVNHSFELLMGRDAEELVGQPIQVLFPPDQAEYAMRLIHTTREGVRWESVEIPILHTDGMVKAVVWNSSTIYTPDGKTPIAIIAQGRDVTVEKLLEKEKERAMIKIQENIAQLAILNDGIRNPLTIIASYADMIDPEISEKINEQVMRIDAMVTNLDREWIHSEKILNYLRKQDKIVPDLFSQIHSVPEQVYPPETFSKPSHQISQSVSSAHSLYIEEIQAQLYTILDSIDALVYVSDMDTYDILYMNERGRRQYGTVHGQKCYAHIHGQTGGPCPFCTNHLLMGKNGPTGVYRWEYKDARTGRWYDCRDRAIRWTDGRLVRLEIATDITDLKKSEEALKRSEQRVRAVLESIPEGIIVADVRTKRFIFVNEAMCRMLGSSRKTLIGQTPAEIHPTYALPLIMSDFEKMRSGEVMFISNIPMQRKDGSIFYADVHSSPLELDGQPALLGVFHDCTDRILADEENKLHLTRLQSFLSLLGMVDSSEKEIMSYALAQSLQITKSRYAFIGTLTPDESEMIIHAWSDNVMELCKIQDKPMRFPLHNAGIWGNCIRIRTASIMNDYSLPDPAKHGYPEGHVQITRFLGVPIFDNDTIVAILAVANKETEYQDDDVNALQTLGSMMWEIIRRRRTEEDLLRQHETLLSAYEEIRVSEEELRQNYDEIAANRQELIERERQLQLKLDSILTPEYDITEEEFGNIIDSHEIQLLMDDFYALTHIGIAILDLKGNILVATGWQDICTKFHRVNEESAKNCRDSDIFLTTNVKPGQYLVYKCKNNMWDMVTPIFLGEKHMGNLFLGQFFFDDEVPDREVFTAQAERFGFDTDEYLAALDRVPRWSRETVTTVMDFYTRFSSLISQLSYRNVSLARALLDQKRMAAELRASKDRLTNIIQNTPAGYFRIDRGGNFVDVNDAWLHMHKYHDRSEVIGKHFSITQVDENIVLAQRNVEKMLSGESVPFGEFTRRCKDGSIGVHIFSAIPVREDGKIVGIEGFLIDITHKKRSEEELIRSESEKRSIIQTIPDLIWLKDPDGVFLSCNRAFERLYGAKEQEIVGKTDYDFVDKELADFFREHDQRAMAADRPCVNEEWLTFAEDGYHGLFETIKTPMKDPEGRIIGILGIARDITNRKRIEDALRESEERFRGLMDTITSGVATYTVQGDGSKGKDYIIKDFNRMALEIEGKTLEEVVGKSLADLRPNIDEYGLIPVFQQVWKTGIPAYYPQKIYIDDKYANWYENRIFKLESGEIVAVYNDVTEQKRAEEALQESRDLLDATQKLTRIGGWEWHVGRQTMTWTIETYRIHEIDPDEIPPGSPDLIALSLSCYDPEDRPVIRDAFELCATKGISYDMIFPFTTTKGKRIWIRTAAEAIVADGKVIRVIGNIMDITDQKLTEEALHESEEKYRLIADNTADHIWISDMNLKLTYSSPSVLKMKGFTAQETLEQSLDEMLTPTSVEMVLKLFEKEMEAELNGTADPNRTIYFITEEYCKDGSVIFVENSAILLRDTDGRPTSILGISRDITERKKMEDALKQSNQKLRLLTSLTRHDILNLINSIKGFLELASMSSDLKESRYYISKCKEAGDRIEMTIGFTREYEDFGIISSGWVQVVPVIRSAWEEVNPTEIRFESEISSSLEIFADPLIRKVFSTLIENSVRHGQRTTFIRFSEMFTDNACIIVCEDDGIGILENEKDLIFEHGYGKHTGIGLFLSREILSITGLSIHECGEEGKGARFEITVPKGKFRIKEV